MINLQTDIIIGLLLFYGNFATSEGNPAVEWSVWLDSFNGREAMVRKLDFFDQTLGSNLQRWGWQAAEPGSEWFEWSEWSECILNVSSCFFEFLRFVVRFNLRSP